MTHDELMALPDVTPRMNFTEQEVDGRLVQIPTAMGGFSGALFTGPDDGSVVDANGVAWMVGQHGGVRVRRRM
jgi:sugar lactone lactonase YvrE